MKKKDLMLILVPVGFLVGYYLLKGSKIIPQTTGKTPAETARSNSLNTLMGNLITPVSNLLSGVISGFTSVFSTTPATASIPNYLQTQSQDVGGFFAPSDFAQTFVPDIFSGAIDYSDAGYYNYGGSGQNF